jgi:FkbM family methyltransferase
MTRPVFAALKARVSDTRAEPVLRWLVKRSRGIRMPFDLVKNEIYDRQAGEVMRRVLKPNSNCVDIGCHQGQFLREFIRLAPQGCHWAFEPIPHLAEALRREFPAVQVMDAALSDRSGQSSFFVLPDRPARSGLHKREFIGNSGARQEIRVRTERLDDLVPSATKIDFMKIDVEGAEGLVISGSLETIRQSRPHIVFEHGRQSSLDFGFAPERIYDLLATHCGLRVSLLCDWLYGRAPLTKGAFTQNREWYFLAHP